MPNHCHNDLYITGPQEQVEALLQLIGADKEEPAFDFNTVIQYPAHFAELDKEFSEMSWKAFRDKHGADATDGYNSGGYEWCCDNWGTKWNAYEVARRDYLRTCITFQTAWSPPTPVIVELHKRFPQCRLSLEWFEMGMAKCGGFSLIPEDEWYEDEPWVAGTKLGEWSGEYRGHRGG
jgi:hypothetical protein